MPAVYNFGRILASDYNCGSYRIQTIGSSPSGGSVSPILVRPVREQLEHDRVIRLLMVRLKRKGEVVANIGESQTAPIRVGQVQLFPDLVLTTADRGHKLVGTVEVETAESVTWKRWRSGPTWAGPGHRSTFMSRRDRSRSPDAWPLRTR